MLLHILQEKLHFLIFMKKLYLWKLVCWYAEENEARIFYAITAEKQINCVTGNTLFWSKISVNFFKVEIYVRLIKMHLSFIWCSAP